MSGNVIPFPAATLPADALAQLSTRLTGEFTAAVAASVLGVAVPVIEQALDGWKAQQHVRLTGTNGAGDDTFAFASPFATTSGSASTSKRGKRAAGATPAAKPAVKSRQPMLVASDGVDLVIDMLDDASVARIDPSARIAYEARPQHVTFAPVDDATPIPQHVPQQGNSLVRCKSLRRVLYRIRFAPATPGLTRRALYLLVRVWFVVQLLRRYLPTRPIAIFHGVPGSGKTSAARALGRLLLGPEFEVGSIPPTERDLAVTASATPYLAIDNVEHVPRWFPEAIARTATGGKYSARALNTDAKRATFRPDAFCSITTATAEWLTGYVLDRALIIGVEKTKQRLPELVMNRIVDAARADVMAEALAVAADVHAHLSKHGPPQLVITGHDGKDVPVDVRLADFASVGYVAAEVMDGPGAGQDFLRALLAMESERRAFATGTDAMLGALIAIANAKSAAMTSFELLNELAIRMGAQMYRKHLDGDPTKLGKAIAEIRTRAAGLVDIRVTYPQGKAHYEVRSA